MSSLPGVDLSDYVCWNYDIVLADSPYDPNISLGFAEVLGTISKRPRLTMDQFQPLLALYEPYRGYIEDRLLDFDEEKNGSWRDYASYAFESVPDEVYDSGRKYLKSLLNQGSK